MSTDVLEKQNSSNVVPFFLCPDSVLPHKQRAELLEKKKVANCLVGFGHDCLHLKEKKKVLICECCYLEISLTVFPFVKNTNKSLP